MTDRREYSFEVWQGGIMVASGSGPDKDFVEGEGWHYARQYAQDGEVELKFPHWKAKKR